MKYLPNIGTLGSLITFYYIFAYNAPNVPLVPYKGPEDELFFDQSKYPAANQALIDFRKGIEALSRLSNRTGFRRVSGHGILSFSTL
jgi:hypothetical protein